MVLAIWIATRIDNVFHYLGSPLFVRLFIGLFAAALVSWIIRCVRRASLADIHPSPILDAWFLARFTVMPAVFLLGLLWLLAWALGLGFAQTVGEAVLLTVMHGAAAILLTSAVADLAAALRGPGRAPPADA